MLQQLFPVLDLSFHLLLVILASFQVLSLLAGLLVFISNYICMYLIENCFFLCVIFFFDFLRVKNLIVKNLFSLCFLLLTFQISHLHSFVHFGYVFSKISGNQSLFPGFFFFFEELLCNFVRYLILLGSPFVSLMGRSNVHLRHKVIGFL